MGRYVEGLEVSVIAAEPQTKIGRATEFVVERLPFVVSHLPIIRQALRPYASTVLPRPVETKGALNDAQEAQEVQLAIEQLRAKLPAHRQPDVDDSRYVEVKRVRRGTMLDHIWSPVEHGRVRILRHRDVTADYFHSVRTSANEGFDVHPYDADQDVVTAAEALSQDLAHHRIIAPEEGVRRLVHKRLGVVRQNLNAGFGERLFARPAAWIVDHINNYTRHIGVDLDRFAIDVALEGQRYAAVSGKQPEVGFGGLMLGTAELGLGLFNMALKRPKNDAVEDFLVGTGYQLIKYPTKRVFGEIVEHTSTNRVLELAGATPVLPATWGLWAVQMVGRQLLRDLINDDDATTHEQLAQIAALGVKNDFYRFNREQA